MMPKARSAGSCHRRRRVHPAAGWGNFSRVSVVQANVKLLVAVTIATLLAVGCGDGRDGEGAANVDSEPAVSDAAAPSPTVAPSHTTTQDAPAGTTDVTPASAAATAATTTIGNRAEAVAPPPSDSQKAGPGSVETAAAADPAAETPTTTPQTGPESSARAGSDMSEASDDSCQGAGFGSSPACPADLDVAVARGALAFLTAEMGVAQSELALTGAEPVTWSDGSLGCMQEGYAYTGAEEPGFRFTFSHGDSGPHLVHSDETGSWFVRPLGCSLGGGAWHPR